VDLFVLTTLINYIIEIFFYHMKYSCKEFTKLPRVYISSLTTFCWIIIMLFLAVLITFYKKETLENLQVKFTELLQTLAFDNQWL